MTPPWHSTHQAIDCGRFFNGSNVSFRYHLHVCGRRKACSRATSTTGTRWYSKSNSSFSLSYCEPILVSQLTRPWVGIRAFPRSLSTVEYVITTTVSGGARYSMMRRAGLVSYPRCHRFRSPAVIPVLYGYRDAKTCNQSSANLPTTVVLLSVHPSKLCGTPRRHHHGTFSFVQ